MENGYDYIVKKSFRSLLNETAFLNCEPAIRMPGPVCGKIALSATLSEGGNNNEKEMDQYAAVYLHGGIALPDGCVCI